MVRPWSKLGDEDGKGETFWADVDSAGFPGLASRGGRTRSSERPGGETGNGEHCGEDGGGGEMGGVLQPLLGCEGGEAVARSGQMGDGVFVPDGSASGSGVE